MSENEQERPSSEQLRLVGAAKAAMGLIASPASWINRRVETIEMLSREETRRRVSVDYTLDQDQRAELTMREGVVVPISVLAKQHRRNFDLRDESGSAVPVLGKKQNGNLAHVAAMNAALEALPDDVPQEVFEMLWTDIRQVVCGDPEDAVNALAVLVGAVEQGDRFRRAIWQDATCRELLTTLAPNYVLFAVLPDDGPDRRILKYAYGDDFDFTAVDDVAFGGDGEERDLGEMVRRAFWDPDRRSFVIECPGAARAASFHAEVVIPEELRVDFAMLWDFEADRPLSDPEIDVNRASLYSPERLDQGSSADVFVELTPERTGMLTRGALASVVVTILLWLGVAADLEKSSIDATTSILLAGAALFSGAFAVAGEHHLVAMVLGRARLWLGAVAFAAFVASATLAVREPQDPTLIWICAGVVCTLATVRSLWSVVRAPKI